MNTKSEFEPKYIKSYLDDTINAAKGRWIEIAMALSPRLNDALNKTKNGKFLHVVCPSHGTSKNKGDGFRLFDDFDQEGGSICNTCGANSTGFNSIGFAENLDFRDVLDDVASYLDIASPNRLETNSNHKRQPRPVDHELLEKRKKEQELAKQERIKIQAKLKSRINNHLEQSFPANAEKNNHAIKYLEGRGIKFSEDQINALVKTDALRSHAMDFWEDGKCIANQVPTLIAKIHNSEDKLSTLHRIFLDAAGDVVSKAGFKNCKKMMEVLDDAPISGGSIRMVDLNYSNNPIIHGVGEGIETMSAVFAATDLPVRSCINATLLGSYTPPKGTDIVVIFEDQDIKKVINTSSGTKLIAAGEVAADKLESRLIEMDIGVIRMSPNEDISEGGCDWLDVYKKRGSEYISSNFMKALLAYEQGKKYVCEKLPEPKITQVKEVDHNNEALFNNETIPLSNYDEDSVEPYVEPLPEDVEPTTQNTNDNVYHMDNWAKDSQLQASILAKKEHLINKGIRTKLLKLWEECLSMQCSAADPAKAYFARNGVRLQRERWMLFLKQDSVRYHPEFDFGEGVKSPAIISKLKNANGSGVSLHVMPISLTGRNTELQSTLLEIPSDRSIEGSSIPLLDPVNGVLSVSVGVETAMAVYSVTGLPAWSVLDENMLETMEIPDTVNTLLVWSKHDRSGLSLKASLKLKDRLEKKGIYVHILQPRQPILVGEECVTWKDVLILNGLSGFPKQKNILNLIESRKDALKEAVYAQTEKVVSFK